MRVAHKRVTIAAIALAATLALGAGAVAVAKSNVLHSANSIVQLSASSAGPALPDTHAPLNVAVDEPGDLRGTIDGDRVRYAFDPDRDTYIGLAVWAHGRGGDVNARMDEGWFDPIIDAGWVIASGDFRLDAWGNPAALTSLRATVDIGKERFTPPTLMLVGGSMGALTTLNAMRLGYVDANCWYGTMPAVNLTAVSATLPGAPHDIVDAYGGDPSIDFDPSKGTRELPAIPYHVLASPDDTQVVRADNGDMLAGLLPEGATLTEKAATGEHGDNSHFDPADLAQFAATCAGTR